MRRVGKDRYGNPRYVYIAKTEDGRIPFMVVDRKGRDRFRIGSTRDAKFQEKRATGGAAKVGPMNEERNLQPIDSPQDIPTDLSDEEQIAFLEAHGVSEEFLENTEEVPDEERPRPRTKPINVRFDDFTLGRLKGMAERRNVGYQTLLKTFVLERLYEEERREGVLPAGRAEEDAAQDEAAAEQEAPKKRDWQQQAYDFVKEHEPIVEDDDLDFIVSSRILSDASSLLLRISNEIKAASAKEKFPAARLKRMLKGYDKLKEFIDRAFAVHEEKFGLPEPEEDGGEHAEVAVFEEDEEPAIDDENSEATDPEEHGATVTHIQEAMRRRRRAEGDVEPLRDSDKGAM